MQTPVDDSDIFTEVSRSAQAPPSPRWSPLQEYPCEGLQRGLRRNMSFLIPW